MFLVAVTGYILLLNTEIDSKDGADTDRESLEFPEQPIDGVRKQPSVLTSGTKMQLKMPKSKNLLG